MPGSSSSDVDSGASKQWEGNSACNIDEKKAPLISDQALVSAAS
jgi:hypothetical protein